MKAETDEACAWRGLLPVRRAGRRAATVCAQVSPASRCARLAPVFVGVAALLAVATLAPLWVAGAEAHGRGHVRGARISLVLPASAFVGSRVQAGGAVAGASRARRVVLQQRSRGRWRALAAAAVSHGRWRIAFMAPRVPLALTVRAVLYRRRRRVKVSRALRIVIRAHPRPVPPPAGGNAAAWGGNSHYQLGAGFKDNFSAMPVPVVGLTGIRAVAATYFSSYALMSDGTVRGWGGDTFGQLGNGIRTEWIPTPVSVAGLSGVTAIAAGGAHALALLGNGTVATWGEDNYGTLGDGTTAKGLGMGLASALPVAVPGLSGVVAIAAGGGDDAALLANGTVVAWGENQKGQLGDGTTVEKPVPTPVQGLAGVKAIALGGIPSHGGHLLALLDDGTVRAVGANGAGQLGDATTTSRSTVVTVAGLSGVKAIAASGSHSLALLENGEVAAWGSDEYGELGVAGPELCPGNTAVAPPVPCSRVPVRTGLQNVGAIAAGWRFSLAVSGGGVLAWGANDVGQLGNGTTAGSPSPVPVGGLSDVAGVSAGESHSLALLAESRPPAPIEVHPGPGSLTITWSAAAADEPWTVSWRQATHPRLPWGKFVPLPASTRSYTITGLTTGVSYEAVVRSKGLGSKIVTGVPG